MGNDVLFGISKQVPTSLKELEGILKKYPKHHKHHLIGKHLDLLL